AFGPRLERREAIEGDPAPGSLGFLREPPGTRRWVGPDADQRRDGRFKPGARRGTCRGAGGTGSWDGCAGCGADAFARWEPRGELLICSRACEPRSFARGARM